MSNSNSDKGLWDRLNIGLKRSASVLGKNLKPLLLNRNNSLIEFNEIQELLISADLGVKASEIISNRIIERNKNNAKLNELLATEIENILSPLQSNIEWTSADPFILLVVGANGTGKTTTIGKIACKLKSEGRSVLLVGCDTFRAAAVDQLAVWGERAGVEVKSSKPGMDPAGLSFDAIDDAQKRGLNTVIIDTAGRLHNKETLMAELDKIIRAVKKRISTAPHGVLLVLDATTGQNASSQVAVFNEVCNLTGIVMTKLDGTAKGGMLVSLALEQNVPITYIGIGEEIDDLQPFNATTFSKALVGLDL